MRAAAREFYPQLRGPDLEEHLELRDVPYEHEALDVLRRDRWRSRDRPARERLRVKTVLLPEAPSIAGLTRTLQLLRRHLPELVAMDGSTHRDLQSMQSLLETGRPGDEALGPG
ncbi:unnamed protein product [Prorocentrum cordatum]|uniref:Uncharacterized protein n=1 Tax=Prorocentrum cordatum TaxID=2364126 RepID=A0ABN9SVB5_9DINO|nr:unnamed protein product [Polarella glacialis]